MERNRKIASILCKEILYKRTYMKFQGESKRVAVWKWAFLDNIGKKKKKIIKNKKKKKEKRKRGSSNFSYVITRPLFVQNGHQAWGYCLIQRPLNATGRVGKEALLRSLISPSLHCKRQIMDLLTTQLGEENCWRTREKKAVKNCPVHSSIIRSIPFKRPDHRCIFHG